VSVQSISLPRRVRFVGDHPVLTFLVRRIVLAILTLWVVSIIVFIATSVLPGNAAKVILGKNVNPHVVLALEKELHLNQSLWGQYWYWVGNFIHGNLGRSAASIIGSTSHETVASLIRGPLVHSAVLAGITLLLLIPLSLGLGVLLATRAGKWIDHVVSISTLAAISMPEFVTGSVLIWLFATELGIFPAVSLIGPGQGPFSNPNILVLPVLTLLCATLAQCVRMVRAGMIETLRSDYVQAARLAGVNERRVLFRYALRNALAPAVQVIALNAQWLVGGIVVTETIFGYPGLGQLIVNSINLRDIPTVQSVAMLLAVFYMALNIISDLLIIYLVPKLRTSQ
jgi:peptide/nickel transport system permease protein